MAMSTATRVETLVVPLLEEAGLELYDLELAGGVLRVLVDRDGGADIDVLSQVARRLTRALDEHDPTWTASNALEVSTPGLERPLRTAAHFRGALGAEVKVKTHPGVEGDRRVDGVVAQADEDTVTVTAADGSARTLRYDEIERARTVFVWGPTDPPKSKRSKKP